MDDLTTPEIHNWYNNIVKRFGWIALSANDNNKTKNFKNEINDLIDKTERKFYSTNDPDTKTDLNTMTTKLKALSSFIDVIKNGGNKKKKI